MVKHIESPAADALPRAALRRFTILDKRALKRWVLLLQAWADKAASALRRAEQRVAENFRVPPNGG
ncbi:hypothetical protein OOZ63_24820 [Paucibacter sp. PLA-PC-4]|uniref:hypothetical protein n=1 Tax=Paucibacter sp. PLA-PC-4 TaxID=2993655 RepID=UPI00224AC872|nr:hypothetical protein [Paucibacter sp. PLA-PC-4]MCX2865055.1 hypothetical protein [Paucibacter sp. PLA-PC-4]